MKQFSLLALFGVAAVAINYPEQDSVFFDPHKYPPEASPVPGRLDDSSTAPSYRGSLSTRSLVRRGPGKHPSASVPNPSDSRRRPPGKTSSVMPIGQPPSRAGSPVSAPSVPSRTKQRSALSAELRAVGPKKSLLTQAIKEQKLASDAAYSKIADPQKAMNDVYKQHQSVQAWSNVLPPLGIPAKHAAAQHAAAAHLVAQTMHFAKNDDDYARRVNMASSYASSSFAESRTAPAQEVGSAEKHAVLASEYAKMARNTPVNYRRG